MAKAPDYVFYYVPNIDIQEYSFILRYENTEKMEELLSTQRPAAAVGSDDAGQPSPGWDGRYTNKYNR